MVYDIISWLPREEKESFVRHGTYVDIRHFTDPEVFGQITNVQLGNISRESWRSILDATEHLGAYKAGREIKTLFQEMTRNALLFAEQKYEYTASFDEVYIPKQSRHEGKPPLLDSPLPRN